MNPVEMISEERSKSIGRKTLFLVDDDLTNLATGNNALNPHYNVLTMNSGAKLLKMLERHTPDIILLDVEMPEMSGYETIKILKTRKETMNIPVIFLTSQRDCESELKGLSSGAIDYIYKPFSPPLLLKRIENVLTLEKQKRQLIHYADRLEIMVEERTKTVVELKNAFLKTMAELVEYRDGTTGEHIGRTWLYMGILIDSLRAHKSYKDELSTWDRELILQSAQLHDVGKIAIKDHILNKRDKLTREEFDEIKLHVKFGESVIEKIKKSTSERAFLDQAKILIATHHEKWDGSGYPRGLKGKEIALQGRMMALADVYDALTSDRPYKKAYTHEQAVEIIVKDKGKHFDPDLVDVFVSASEKFSEVASMHNSESIEILEEV
jgi:putative two-component system response regulator